jgi:CubicO group peptidase (beta-lactamase class C family)
MNKWSVPGTEFTIAYKNKLLCDTGYGYANFGEHVHKGNLFRIASDSKIFTAIAILQLAEQNKLQLDDHVFGKSGILDRYNRYIDPRVGDITVRMLLHHRGGWDRDLYPDIKGDPTFNAWTIANIAHLKSSPPSTEVIINYVLQDILLDYTPDSTFAYSNFGYLLLGQIVEKVSGMKYEEYINKYVLQKLDIDDMVLGQTFPDYSNLNNKEAHYFDYPGAPLVTNCYDPNLTSSRQDTVPKVPNPYGGFDMGTFNSFGRWLATSKDLVKMLIFLRSVLNAESFRLLTTPYLPEHYGMGIYILGEYSWHNGSLPGTTAEFIHCTNGFDCAIVMNTRAKDEKKMNSELHTLLKKIIQNVQP